MGIPFYGFLLYGAVGEPWSSLTGELIGSINLLQFLHQFSPVKITVGTQAPYLIWINVREQVFSISTTEHEEAYGNICKTRLKTADVLEE
jgi:hypothetical protein